MEKRLRVGVVRIPVGFTPFNELSSCYEIFRPNSMNELSKAVISHLQEMSSEFGKHGVKLEIEDCGDRPGDYRYGDAISKRGLRKVGEALKEMDAKHDVLIVLGMRHTPAHALYRFPGKVIRVDFHSDASDNHDVEYSSYLHHALIVDRLKDPDDVMHYGLGSLAHRSQAMTNRDMDHDMRWHFQKQVGRNDLSKVEAPTFDIDLDGLELKYQTVARDLLGDELEFDRRQEGFRGVAMSELGQAIIRSGPKRVGVFEYSPQDRNAVHMERAIKALSKAAVIGAAKRKGFVTRGMDPRFRRTLKAL
jgi:hypothetical protein